MWTLRTGGTGQYVGRSVEVSGVETVSALVKKKVCKVEEENFC